MLLRTRLRHAVLLGFLGLLGAGEARGAVIAREDTLYLAPDEQVACLSRSYVLPSTLVLREGDRALQAGREFVLDDRTGCLTVFTPDTLGIGRRFVAVYQALDPPLAGTYRLAEDPRRAAPAAAPAAPDLSRPARSFTEEEVTRGLTVSGSNTLGIEVGSGQDAALRQSLDLRLSGKVGHDVSLLAILSDQDIPFQPEGNTAELEELDRVLVQIESPRAGATLGDLDLAAGGFTFLEVAREMEGFSGRAQVGPGAARAALASAKGEYTTREFFAVEGKQGPYRLTDRTGAEGIVVVAGSEKVWLDGIPQRRGQEADYVIDYATGEIAFTSRHVLTAFSRITVDYQVATGRYRRGVFLAAADRMELGPLGLLRGAYFAEGDDADNVLGGDLSDVERALLAAVGDSATVEGGTRYVGPGCDSCAYTLALDPESGREIFVYVEAGGDYVVSFVNVGENQGEYEVDPDLGGAVVAYRFVGEGRGRFIPRRDLPAPENRRLGTVRWEWKGAPGTVAVEGALSDADGNTLSPLDDDDNAGEAFTADVTGAEIALGKARLAPRARWRRVSEGFQSPGRIRPGFYGRTWNLVGTEPIHDENLLEGGFGLRFGETLRYNIEAGRLALADTFTAVRQHQDVQLTNRWTRSTLEWTTSRDETGGREGGQDIVGGTFVLARWKVEPRVSAAVESRKRPEDGERVRSWDAGLGFPLGPLRANVGGGRRLDDSLHVEDASWREVRDTRLAYAQAEGTAGNLSVLGRVDRRDVQGPGGPSERRHSARVDVHHQALRGAWRGSVTSELGTVGLRRQTKSIVADTTGSFDRFGNYVGQGGGYDVVFGAPGAEELVRRLDLVTRLRWYPPGPEVALPGVLRAVGWEGYLTLGRAASIAGEAEASTLEGTIEERQIVELWPRNARAGIRLRQESVRRESRSAPVADSTTVDTRGEDQFAVALRASPDPAWDGELEGSLRVGREEIDLGAGGRYEEISRLRGVTLRGGRRWGSGRVTGRLSVDGVWNRETRDEDVAEGWTVRPRMQGSLGRTARIELRPALTVLTRNEGFAPTGPGASTLREGWRLDVVMEVRLTPGIVLTGTLVLDRPAEGADNSQARLEARGSF